MSKPRKHHYLPISYQEQFVNLESGLIYALQLKTDEIKPISPYSFGKKTDLYKVKNPSEGKIDTYIENPYLSEIDGTYPSLIRKLKAKEFSVDDRIKLSLYLSHQRNRTPAYFNIMQGLYKREKMRKFYNSIINNENERKSFEEAGFDLTTFDNFDFEIPDADNDILLPSFLRLSHTFAKIIENTNWEIISSGKETFITSDAAFVHSYDEFRDEYSGVIRAKSYYLFPLSSNMCLRLCGEGNGLVFRESFSGEVDDINEAIAYGALDWLRGSNPEVIRNAAGMAQQRKKEVEAEEARREKIDRVLRWLTSDPIA